VYFPAGTYSIQSAITIDASVKWVGPGTIKLAGGSITASGVISNITEVKADIPPHDPNVLVDSTTGFSANDLVLLYATYNDPDAGDPNINYGMSEWHTVRTVESATKLNFNGFINVRYDCNDAADATADYVTTYYQDPNIAKSLRSPCRLRA